MHAAAKRVALTCALAAAFVAVSCSGSTSHDEGREFDYHTSLEKVDIRYAPGPPAHLYDSSILNIALWHDPQPDSDSLLLEWLPSRSGWSLPIDSFMVRDSTGWYRARVWICPTEPGEFMLRWQTSPFTGFTFHLAARYDSTGKLTDWDDTPVATAPVAELYPRDTMEFVFNNWPHIFYRRIRLIRVPDQTNKYWIILQSLYRSAGASGRQMRPSANLTFDPRYPLRTRQWLHGGWVADTLLATVRGDTMVAAIDWSFQGICDNWERNATLYREWNYTRHPQIFFQLDPEGHIQWASKEKPANRLVAAQLAIVKSEPDYDSVKAAFKTTSPDQRTPIP